MPQLPLYEFSAIFLKITMVEKGRGHPEFSRAQKSDNFFLVALYTY